MGYKYIGDQNFLSFQFESGTYASPSGARQWIGLCQDHSPEEVVNVEQVRYQGNYSRGIGIFTDGKLENGGTFNYYPQDFKFLGFAIGSVQNLTGSHLITETNSNNTNYAVASQSLQSFTLEDSKRTAATGSNFIRTYNGCMVDTFKLRLSEGEIVNCEVGYKAQSVVYSSGTVTTVTARTTKPYMWSNTRIHMPSGTPMTNCTTFDFTVNNNLESRFPLNGSRTVEQLVPLNRDYSVDATFLMDSANANTFYNTYYKEGGSFNAMIELKATAGSAFIIMSGCRITDMTVPSPVEGLTEQTFTIIPTNVAIDVYDTIGSYSAW